MESLEALWRAVLLRAIEDLSIPSTSTQSSRNWFINDGWSIGSYRWVCAIVGVDSARLRVLLKDKIYIEFNGMDK